MALPNTLRLTARSVTDPTWPHCPMPGDRLSDSIVVASVNYREKGGPDVGDGTILTGDMFTVILLNPAPPFYTVAVLMHYDDAPGTYKVDWAVSHANIVPAVTGEGDDHNGYTDMGGDY